MEQKIKQINEAFSMQPKCLRVVTESDFEFKYDKENAIEEIKLECVIIGDNPATAISEMMYVGYDYMGRKRFEYLAKSVNVEYYYPETDAEPTCTTIIREGKEKRNNKIVTTPRPKVEPAPQPLVMQRSEQLISLLKKLYENNMCSRAGDELIEQMLKCGRC